MVTWGTGGRVRTWVAPVAIYRLLQKSAFEPDDIKRMTTAYETALVQLELKDRNDPLTELIAKLILEVGPNALLD